MPPRRARAALLAVLVSAVAAGPAAAAVEVTHDRAGRPITFDVEAPDADVGGFTRILDGLLHGAEISSVTITIVPQAEIPSDCGGDGKVVACYRWTSHGDARMYVPDVPAQDVRQALTHEYGHHVDATRPHIPGAPGLDGTAAWWRARDMGARLARGEVAWDYSLGWDHSIAEIFAEDYAVTNGAGHSEIRWLGDPPPAVQDAIRADLGVAPSSSAVGAGAAARTERVLARRRGRLLRGARVAVPIRVRVATRLRVRVAGGTAGRLRAVLRCGGRAVAAATARPDRAAMLRARVAPGRCRVVVRAVGADSRYAVAVRAA